MKHIILIFIITIQGIIMATGTNGVAKSANDICPLKIGSEIPSVMITSLDGTQTDIQQITKNKKSIIIFYRGSWCPYCNIHLSDLQNYETEILQNGFQIIAISIDRYERLKSTIDKHQLNYELFSDSKADASIAFGIAFHVDDDYFNKLKSYNMDIEENSGESHHILPVPSVFIVNENNLVIFNYVNPNYKHRLDGKLLLEIVKQIK